MFNPQKEQGGYYGPMTMQVSPDVPMIAGFKEGVCLVLRSEGLRREVLANFRDSDFVKGEPGI